MNMTSRHRPPKIVPGEEPVSVTLLLQDQLLPTDFYLPGHTFEFALTYPVAPLEEMSSPAGSHRRRHVLIHGNRLHQGPLVKPCVKETFLEKLSLSHAYGHWLTWCEALCGGG